MVILLYNFILMKFRISQNCESVKYQMQGYMNPDVITILLSCKI